ncbi:hypothetical protein PF005_g8816 [Phytophthora fragariae]|uniref:Uncharacterized protein n=1 Tax=Phytophthora fragariae TaxID=53985 RepID=A0A6A3YFE5_9STRA|nr:hypothetical protein PF005_g8816 [Phytophthora fragariae]KAE9312370.1 hypothetical protein PF001_g9268 [Phytophthora fragariae]KAE9343842.1 hypothetical protein PF008_g9505 [Phytophthora fragariae]
MDIYDKPRCRWFSPRSVKWRNEGNAALRCAFAMLKLPRRKRNAATGKTELQQSLLGRASGRKQARTSRSEERKTRRCGTVVSATEDSKGDS